MNAKRPAGAAPDRLFVVLKGPRRGQPLSIEGVDEIISGARAGLCVGTCHELRHTCLTRLREAGTSIGALKPRPVTARSLPPSYTCIWERTGWPRNIGERPR
jgi:integrase